MAVITRFIVVRNGVELNPVFTDRKEAEAYDKLLDAAENLAKFIKESDLEIQMDPQTIDAVSILLAKNASKVTMILKSIKPITSPSNAAMPEKPLQPTPAEEKSNVQESKPKSPRRGS